KQSLWTARGTVEVDPATRKLFGALSLRAERFSLDRVLEILPASLLNPQNTTVDAALSCKFDGDKVGFDGSFDVSGLSIQHEMLATDPIVDTSFGLQVDGSLDLGRRRLEIAKLEARVRQLAGQLSGSIELQSGTFAYKDGSQMRMVP